jgi:hypothetical protein
MGVGVALGLVAAIPSGGLSLVGGVLGGGAGGGVIGEFFHKGLKMTDDEAARIGRELDAGHAAVGYSPGTPRPRPWQTSSRNSAGLPRPMRWPS